MKIATGRAGFFLFRLCPLITYCCLIFYLSSIEARNLRPYFFFSGEDKILHLIEYAILGFLLMRCMGPWRENPCTRGYCIFFGLIYGISDEFHQAFVPGREASAWDVLADMAGLMLVSLSYEKIFRKRGHPLK